MEMYLALQITYLSCFHEDTQSPSVDTGGVYLFLFTCLLLTIISFI